MSPDLSSTDWKNQYEAVSEDRLSLRSVVRHGDGSVDFVYDQFHWDRISGRSEKTVLDHYEPGELAR